MRLRTAVIVLTSGMAFLLLWALPGAARSVQQPAFDAASIRVVKLSAHPVFGNRGGPGTSDPSRIHLCCVGMFSLLMRAFDVELDQIAGPPWIMENMGPNLYQLDAVMTANTTKPEFQSMMQHLLQTRFHLQVHREKQNYPGYELVIAEGGAKLKESRPDSEVTPSPSTELPKRGADGALILPAGPQMFTTLGAGTIIIQAQQKPIGELVKGLGRLIAQSLGENPNDFDSPQPRVIDKTGLSATYDFTLRFSCELCQFAVTNGGFPTPPTNTDSSSASDLPNIFAALPRQLGLKLVKVKDIPLDRIVVDHVDKTPTAN